MHTQRIPPQELESLALFPLPNLVLFPGALLPLHIFEPRYREMTRDVLAGGRLMAVGRLRPGFERDYEGRPPVFDTAGVGYVIADEQLDDGRYNLVLRGVGRVSIEAEHPSAQAYRRVRARLLGDAESRRPLEIGASSAQLVAMCERLASTLGDAAETLHALVRSRQPAHTLADALGAALVTDADHRQTLLEMLDVADRLDFLIEHVARLSARLGAGADYLN